MNNLLTKTQARELVIRLQAYARSHGLTDSVPTVHLYYADPPREHESDSPCVTAYSTGAVIVHRQSGWPLPVRNCWMVHRSNCLEENLTETALLLAFELTEGARQCQRLAAWRAARQAERCPKCQADLTEEIMQVRQALEHWAHVHPLPRFYQCPHCGDPMEIYKDRDPVVPLASEVVALAAKWVRENVAPRAEVDFRRAFEWVERAEALEQHLAFMGRGQTRAELQSRGQPTQVTNLVQAALEATNSGRTALEAAQSSLESGAIDPRLANLVEMGRRHFLPDADPSSAQVTAVDPAEGFEVTFAPPEPEPKPALPTAALGAEWNPLGQHPERD